MGTWQFLFIDLNLETDIFKKKTKIYFIPKLYMYDIQLFNLLGTGNNKFEEFYLCKIIFGKLKVCNYKEIRKISLSACNDGAE